MPGNIISHPGDSFYANTKLLVVFDNIIAGKQPTCTTKSVNYRNEWTTADPGPFIPGSTGYQTFARLYITMAKNQTFSIKIPKNVHSGGVYKVIQTFYTISAGPPAYDYEVCLSECEGDFNSPVSENLYVRSFVEQFGFFYTWSISETNNSYVKLSSNKDYYVNIKFHEIKNDAAIGYMGTDLSITEY